jgi:hypothetical protein
MRGLAEKIWKQFAPSSCALRAAFARLPAVEVWMPIRIPLSLACRTILDSGERFECDGNAQEPMFAADKEGVKCPPGGENA